MECAPIGKPAVVAQHAVPLQLSGENCYDSGVPF